MGRGGGGERGITGHSRRHLTTLAAGKFKLNNEGFFLNLKYFSNYEALRGVCFFLLLLIQFGIYGVKVE